MKEGGRSPDQKLALREDEKKIHSTEKESIRKSRNYHSLETQKKSHKRTVRDGQLRKKKQACLI